MYIFRMVLDLEWSLESIKIFDFFEENCFGFSEEFVVVTVDLS